MEEKVVYKEVSAVPEAPKATDVVAQKTGKTIGMIIGEIFERFFIFIWLGFCLLFIGVVMITRVLLEKLGVFGGIILFCIYFVSISLPFTVIVNGAREEPILDIVAPDMWIIIMAFWWVILLAVVVIFALSTESGRELFGRAFRGLFSGANVEEGGKDNGKDKTVV